MTNEEHNYLVKVFDEDENCLYNEFVEAFCELDAIMKAVRMLFASETARHAEQLSFSAVKQFVKIKKKS